MNKIFKTLTLLALTIVGMGNAWAETVSIPQTLGQYIATTNASTDGTIKNNDNGGLGTIYKDATATFTLSNETEQHMYLTFMTANNNDSQPWVRVDITNGNGYTFTKTVDIPNTGNWYFSQGTLHKMDVGTVPTGTVTLTFTFGNTSSYVGNLGNIAFVGSTQYTNEPDNYIPLNVGSYSNDKCPISKNDSQGGYKIGYLSNNAWNQFEFYVNEHAYYNLCMAMAYNSGGTMNVVITDKVTGIEEVNQDIVVTSDLAKGYGTEVPMAIAGDIMKGWKTMKLTFTTSGSWFMDYENLRLTKRGDYNPSATLTLKSATLDGVNLSDAAMHALRDNNGSYTISDNIYTTIPPVTALMSDNSPATVTPQVNGNNIVYTITATGYESTLTVEGLHAYTAAPGENTVNLKYTGSGKYGDGNWTDGLYTLLSSSLDGWENSSFKLNATEYTLNVPGNIRVKQLVFKSLGNNYAGDASISAVTSTGATNVWLPTKRYALKDQNYDLVVNIDGHVAGTPIVFNVVREGQPTAWLQLIVEETAGGNPTLTSQDALVDDNNAAITVNFDREVRDVTATLDGTTQLTAKGGSNNLQFAVWGLDYNTNHTLTIAKENICDTHGNNALEDVTVNFAIGAKPTVTPTVFDYVVSTADEFKTALAACKESNKTAAAARKRIFVKNGTYDLGAVITNIDAHNVSIIGESKAGTILSNRDLDGISTSATIQVGNSITGTYIENLTIRNTKDWGTGLFNGGVAVALYVRGSKVILKNVSLESNQDTYVTGHRAYHEDCDIAGSVDFICGGGDNYFANNNLIVTRGQSKNGSVITAPSTSTAQQWGYVFMECQITGVEGILDHSFTLGRPWQGEPRAYYLNTKMFQQPAGNGWSGMSNLPTHFYEYNSMDMSGTALDLSSRGNSSTSTNSYSPILTAAEAEKFTVNNVVGAFDCWNPAKMTARVATATIALSGNDLTWSAVDDALCYVIFKDGKYYANTAATSFSLTQSGNYTVCATNEMGGMSAASNTLVVVITNDAGWATFTPETNSTLSAGAQAYICTEVTDTEVTLSPINGIPAAEGVFVKGSASTAYEATAAANADIVGINYIVGCTEDVNLTSADGAYAIAVNNGHAGLYRINTTVTIPAGRAYLKPTNDPGAKMLRINLGNTTGISSAKVDTSLSTASYNTVGQRVKPSTKGIIISNGRKFINK